jgi:simple sugar transport system permease protein
MMSLGAFLGSILSETSPILLAALAAMFTQRASILNVAVEGMMLVAALASIAVGEATGSVTLGILAALAASLALALVFGGVTILLGADAIVTGLGVNLLAGGLTVFVLEEVYDSPGGLRPDSFPNLPSLHGHWLSSIPVIGPALQGQSMIVLASVALVPLCAIFLYCTPVGASLRAAGEDAHAARAAGISVPRMRLLAMLLSGAVSGLGGAELAMDKLHFFLPAMTSGRGFIGLAAMLFGGGTPWGTMLASFVFGLAGAAADRLQMYQVPSEFVLMVPFVAAILGLTATRLRVIARLRPRPVAKEPP